MQTALHCQNLVTVSEQPEQRLKILDEKILYIKLQNLAACFSDYCTTYLLHITGELLTHLPSLERAVHHWSAAVDIHIVVLEQELAPR
jgi:hypothetical protein